MLGIVFKNVPRRAGRMRRVLKRAGLIFLAVTAAFLILVTVYFLVAFAVAHKAQTAKTCYPPHLEGLKQSDYAFRGRPFALISEVRRKTVALCLVEPPRQDLGNQVGHPWLAKYLGPPPVAAPASGWQWQVSHTTVDERSSFPLFYFAVTAPRGWLLREKRGAWHARLGFRWDDTDGYYVFSVASKWIRDATLSPVLPARRAIPVLPPAYHFK